MTEGDLFFRHHSATEPTGGGRLRPSSRGFFASRKSNLEKGFSRSLIAEGNELRMLRNLQASCRPSPSNDTLTMNNHLPGGCFPPRMTRMIILCGLLAAIPGSMPSKPLEIGPGTQQLVPSYRESFPSG